jgi:hypothetical protein
MRGPPKALQEFERRGRHESIQPRFGLIELLSQTFIGALVHAPGSLPVLIVTAQLPFDLSYTTMKCIECSVGLTEISKLMAVPAGKAAAGQE